MGFAIYRQSKDWSAKDFNTGGDVWASLANVPRQILEGFQIGKENKLKEREQTRKEQEDADQREARLNADARAKQQLEQTKAHDDRMGAYYEESLGLEKTKYNDELKKLDSPEAKEMLKLSMDKERAIIQEIKSRTAKFQRDLKTDPDKTISNQELRKDLAFADVAYAIRGSAVNLFDQETYQKWTLTSNGARPQDLPGLFSTFILGVPEAALNETILEHIEGKIQNYNKEDHLLNVAYNKGEPQKYGIAPIDGIEWKIKKIAAERIKAKNAGNIKPKDKQESISDKIMPKKDNKIQGLFGNFFRGDIE